ncbi:unnamed protein product [Heterosigma akashiwo]
MGNESSNLPGASEVTNIHELVDEDSLICEIHLRACHNLEAADVLGKSDPFVKFQLAVGQRTGPQTKWSSYKTRTLNPTWDPSEVFRFVVNNPETEKLLISVIDHDHLNADDPIGDVVFPLKELAVDGAPARGLRLRLLDRGRPLPGEVELDAYLLSLEKASAQDNNELFEFERYDIVKKEWGGAGFLHADERRFASADLRARSDDFGAVAPPVPPGFVEVTGWQVHHSKDRDGWMYATGPNSNDWYDRQNALCYVRRRKWRRITINPAILDNHEARK